MFKIHTASGSVYTFDPDNKTVVRESDVPLVMDSRLAPYDLTGNPRVYTDFDITPSYWSLGDDILTIRFPEGDYVRSTAVCRVENLTPVG